MIVKESIIIERFGDMLLNKKLIWQRIKRKQSQQDEHDLDISKSEDEIRSFALSLMGGNRNEERSWTILNELNITDIIKLIEKLDFLGFPENKLISYSNKENRLDIIDI